MYKSWGLSKWGSFRVLAISSGWGERERGGEGKKKWNEEGDVFV